MSLPGPPPLPQSSGDKRKRRVALLGIWIGSLLALGPLWGLLGTIVGMTSTFEAMTHEGSGNARELSHGISASLRATELGLLVSPLGLGILIPSIVIFVKLRRVYLPANGRLAQQHQPG